MENLNIRFCENITGACLVFVPRSRAAQAALPSILFLLTSYFLHPPITGDVTQLQLPANMETLNLKECDKLTGEFLVFVPRPSCGSGRKSLLFLYSFLSPSFFVR